MTKAIPKIRYVDHVLDLQAMAQNGQRAIGCPLDTPVCIRQVFLDDVNAFDIMIVGDIDEDRTDTANGFAMPSNAGLLGSFWGMPHDDFVAALNNEFPQHLRLQERYPTIKQLTADFEKQHAAHYTDRGAER